MRAGFLAAALAALSAASPVPQDIDLDLVAAAPDPTYTILPGATGQVVTYDTQALQAEATAVTSVTVQSVPAADATESAQLDKRGNCAAQPSGATGAPTVSTDTPTAFATNAAFASVALNAPVPSGYVKAFENVNASNNAYGYLGYTTLQTYDTQACAAKCNKIKGCQSINILFERDPSLDPGNACTNPASVTMIKCVFWGGPVSYQNANNYGQYRSQFQVVIAGSNGYTNQTLATPAGYSGETYLNNAAINAPYDSQGYNTYMGRKIFTTGTYDPQLCADFCTSQNTYNLAHPPTDGSPVQTCQNTPSNYQGQYCAIYSEPWDKTYATNTGQWQGQDQYLVTYSYTFTNTTGVIAPNKNGAIYQASKDITYSSLQSYCSSTLGYTTPVTTTTQVSTITPAATTVTVAAAPTASSCGAVAKRDESNSTATATATDGLSPLLPPFPSGQTTYNPIPTTPAIQNAKRNAVLDTYNIVEKRDTSTPDVLTKYPATVISSACSLVATPVTTTLTVTVQSTTTVATPTSYVDAKGSPTVSGATSKATSITNAAIRLQKADGTVFGYVRDSTNGAGISTYTTDKTQALLVSVNVPAGQTSGLEIIGSNVIGFAGLTYYGAARGFANAPPQDQASCNSVNYFFSTFTKSHPGPASFWESSVSDATLGHLDVESGIWAIDLSTLLISPQWVNPDGSPFSTPAFYDRGTASIYYAGDMATFGKRFSGEGPFTALTMYLEQQ